MQARSGAPSNHFRIHYPSLRGSMPRQKQHPGAICAPTFAPSCGFTATVEVPACRQGRGLAQLLPNERCALLASPSLLGSVILAGGRWTGRRFPHRSTGQHNCQVNGSCAFLTRTVGQWCVVLMVRGGGERVGGSGGGSQPPCIPASLGGEGYSHICRAKIRLLVWTRPPEASQLQHLVFFSFNCSLVIFSSFFFFFLGGCPC